MNVANTILSAGNNSAPALIYRQEVLTYAELRQKVMRCSTTFLGRNHAKGDRIGIFSENNPFFVVSYLSIIRAGLVAVPFQTELTEQDFKRIVSDAGIEDVCVSRRFINRLLPLAKRLNLNLLTEDDFENGNKKPLPLPVIDSARDLAALMFTSGSTGHAKGVMVTHRNIECNTRDIISYMDLTANDRVMVLLPFHYCFGASLLHSHLMAGGSLVLNNNFAFPETVLQEMQARGCTGLAGVPSTFQILLRKSRLCEMNFPELRWFQQAGGKLPNACIEELVTAFPDVCYYLMYGQTEATARLSYLPPERLVDKMGSIGKGLPSTRLDVLKPDGSPVQPGSNEIGEIVASGDNITAGYWNDPEETLRYFKSGRLHTGDMARVDADGFIFIVERERELIKCKGNRVSAKEIEEVIAEIPGVIETAVVGTPDEIFGEAICAFILGAPGAHLTADLVEGHCHKRLPPFKVPTRIELIGQMPHNGAGKIAKLKLKELAAAVALRTR
ncbi:MAG TPA: AMP-binding protein [Verrucomicrobiae bacterium]|nr:AMP-binding protein [Verrucomicrobiae bacterium]